MFHAIKLSKSDPTPIYIQLASELAKLINEEVLYEGMKLPTIRHLSKQLSINRDTVVSAYKTLEQQGLVESHIGKGTYIAQHLKERPTPQLLPYPSQNPHICCSHLNLSSHFFPTSLCQELTTKVILEEGWEAFNDPLYRERKLLKQSASSYLETLGVHAHFAQVHVINSLNDFLLNLLRFSAKPGICMEAPRDLTLSCTLRSMGAKIYEVPVTNEGMDLEILEKHLKAGTIGFIFIMPYLQNPTGVCYSPSQLEQISELATKYNCLIIEDGTYSDFLNNTPYKPLYNLTSNNHVIYLYHFSKLYLPYMKYSFAVLPTTLVKRFKDDIECSFNERFLRYYLDSNELTTLKKHIISTCKLRYNHLVHKLSKTNSLIHFSNAHGGLSLWCQIPESICNDFYNKLLQQDIIIAPGELFSNQALNNHFRISISNLSIEEIDELVATLTHLLSAQNI